MTGCKDEYCDEILRKVGVDSNAKYLGVIEIYIGSSS